MRSERHGIITLNTVARCTVKTLTALVMVGGCFREWSSNISIDGTNYPEQTRISVLYGKA
jgi:hypothetical protein